MYAKGEGSSLLNGAAMRGSLDFECWDWVNPLCVGFAWGAQSQRETYYIKDPTCGKRPKDVAKAALLFMWQMPEVKQWWAHNGGKYDVLFLIQAAQALQWEFTGHVAGGRAIQVKFRPRHAERWIVVCDSYAVAPSSLKAASVDFELPSRKLFTEEDYSQDPRTWEPERLKQGCLTDCILVLELLDRLEALLESWGGELRTTFSSSALTCVKASLEQRGLALPTHKHDQEANSIARQAYYGARVEIFNHAPKARLKEYDVCSSYPWAMSQALPWELRGYVKNERSADLVMRGEQGYEGVIYARVKVPECQLPVLPYREGNGGIYFPSGEWEAWFPACELRYALSLPPEQRPTINAKDAIVYTRETPFATWIDEVYRVKATAKGAMRTFAKLTLNGCYGKFGQAPETEEILGFSTEEDSDAYLLNQRPGTCGQLGADSKVLTVKRFRWPSHTHYAVASYITGYARQLLHSALSLSEAPAYCDSDSVHCEGDKALVEAGMIGNGLGQLKLEMADYLGQFYAPKVYKLESDERTHLAAKGFPVEQLAFDLLIKQEQVTTERMQLLKSQLRNKESSEVQRRKQVRRWAGRSMKRKPNSDGTTRAWSVTELERGEHLNARSPLCGQNQSELPF